MKDHNDMPGHLARRFQQIAVAIFLAEVEDAGDAKEVAVLLNRPIVAYKKPADITDEILRRLEQAEATDPKALPPKHKALSSSRARGFLISAAENNFFRGRSGSCAL